MLSEITRKIDENIRKTTSGQGNDYITGCLLGYLCIKKNYIS